MSGKAYLRASLSELAAKTATAAGRPLVYWGPDTPSGTRQLTDDAKSGWLDWRTARQMAEQGLKALDAGDLELASSCARAGMAHYVAALEARTARIRPSDAKPLDKPARPRGRPRKNKLPKLAYTVNEGMAALGIGRTKFYELARQGKIDLRKVGGRTDAGGPSAGLSLHQAASDSSTRR